ncbi:virulence factor SrfC family protein [Citrobacter sp. JGM124]|uniref:virulence factor SrfC family protein n=1 Tax=Citrobacter sp. JGM124 TaxID=2799789 RepID=UPI001BA4AC55|nr:virulence factor SrfC family protein [Citrobacter sp. JGM124]MBS0847312.1 hypothetical protein [Citrobacter sp. JGM124]
MNPTTRHFDKLIHWVTTTRASSISLDHQADSLLVNLQQMKARARRLDTLKHQPMTIGFYGHAQAGKHALISTLQRHPSQGVEILLGDKSLDYLTHINPGNVPPAMGVRFTQRSTIDHPQYPLRLALFSECELACQFIERYWRENTAPRHLPASVVATRLAELETRSLPDTLSSTYQEDVALLLLEYRRLLRRDARMGASLEIRISELAPTLGLHDRAELFSLLWGEDPHLTQEWRELAQLLEQLSHPEQVLAPASLLVDSFMLPAEGFLTPVSPHSTYKTHDVLVCPLINGISLPPLNIDQQQLSRICAEVILTQKAGSAAPDVDLLDIPQGQLACYTRRLQPDIVLVCNAVSHVRDTQTTGNALKYWVQNTQISGNGNSPGLIWAITSADSRFTSGINLDESVQRRVGQARTHWGTLQAQDSRNMHLLRDWVLGVLTPEHKAQRLTALNSALEKQVRDLFRGFTNQAQRTPEQEKEHAEKLVRALQGHVLQLGSMLSDLVPSRETLKQCWLLNQQQASKTPHDLGLNIDLFADDGISEEASKQGFSYAKAVHRQWINHLRSPLQPSAEHPRLAVSLELWHSLCEILIVISYRLGLPELLENASDESQSELAIARSHSALGDFVAWLGYGNMPTSQRPLSRINKQQPLFAPASPVDINQRLSKLGDQPQRTNASYAYDWLVALYTRAIENQGYRIPQEKDDQQHLILLKLLA